MPRRPSHGVLEDFRFQPGPLSRQEQLFRAIHAAVAAGALAPGARLPPTRELAATLGTARQTVVGVYERLAAEGLLEGRGAAGSYVAAVRLPARAVPAPSPAGESPATVPLSEPGLRPSRRAAMLAGITDPPGLDTSRPLRPGIPDLAAFPRHAWSRLEARYWRQGAARDLGYGPAAGAPVLQAAIAAFVGAFRGVPCQPDQVIVTHGSQGAVLTAALTVADPGETVIVESPGYAAAHRALLLAGLRLAPAKVDAQGVDPSRPAAAARGGATAGRIRALLCTPAHHYPLGMTMPLERRLALLRWADRTGALLIEDDYDSEFRYDGVPVQTLAALDESRSRVIYLGTLSKLLAPGLRLGFLIVPQPLVAAAAAVRQAMDRHVGAALQHVCAEFIAAGHLAAHIRRMRPLYAARRRALVDALEAGFGGRVTVAGAQTGLHLCALMPDAASEREAAAAAAALGLGPTRLSSYALPGHRPEHWGLALGFAGAEPEAIRRWIAALARSLAHSPASAPARPPLRGP